MRTSRWGAAVAAATLVIGLGIANPHTAAGADLSAGCQELNSSPPNYWAAFIGFAFNSGEVISVNFTNPMDGATTGYLTINSITRDLTSIPGTASWVVRNTDTYSVHREYDTGTSDWAWSCGVAGTTRDQCKNGAWEGLGFKNQGQCVAAIRANAHSDRS